MRVSHWQKIHVDVLKHLPAYQQCQERQEVVVLVLTCGVVELKSQRLGEPAFHLEYVLEDTVNNLTFRFTPVGAFGGTVKA